jgi:hypothetical protein
MFETFNFPRHFEICIFALSGMLGYSLKSLYDYSVKLGAVDDERRRHR